MISMRLRGADGSASIRAKLGLCLTLLLATAAAFAQPKISPPVFGPYTAGDDYFLANYTQLLDYWHKVATESDRIHLEEIGKTAEGRPIVMAIITAPANFKNLARYKEISQRLARAEALTDDQAHALAAEGKAVVWIDGGLHANEVVPAQALFTETYDFLSRSDPEMLRILNDDILLLAPINPDGMELVSNWYMRAADPKQRTMNGLPRLYQKYVGHDNNRDSYIANQPETEAVNRQMYIEWIPQIMYNQHQAGPPGSVLFFSPFRDPFNYNQDPLVPIGIDLVSAAVHQRFLAEGKPGAVMRSNAPYSTWFNGGDRTTTGFHNQIGLLAEIIGGPTPQPIPMIATKLLAAADQPAPIGPRQEWHQRQSIDYLVSSDRAILDIASKYREDFLYRIYRAGKNSIERGSRDTWTLTPKHIAAVEAAYAKEQAAQGGGRGEVARAAADSEGGFGRGANLPLKYWDQLHQPDARDPRGYIVTADQPDFPTATRFIQALQKAGIVVHRATAPFTVAGKSYPAGSYVVQAAQAFRPHLRDMFEPQDHPNDFEYPGGPPKRPYDITGYTLAFQMGVRFDRILEGFDGPFEKLAGLAQDPGRSRSSGARSRRLPAEPQLQRRVPRYRRPAGLRRRDLLAQESGDHWRHEIPAGHDLHRVEARHRGQARATGSPLRTEFRRGRVQTARRRLPVAPRENRTLGPLRRVHGIRPHTLALRAGLPRALRTGLRAGPQCRQSQEQIRRVDLPRRRDSRRRRAWRPRWPGAAQPRKTCPSSIGISWAASPRPRPFPPFAVSSRKAAPS